MTVTLSVLIAVLKTYLYRFHQAPIILQKQHKEWPSQLHSCSSCVIRTGCLTHHRFRYKNVLQRFVGAERSPAFTWYQNLKMVKFHHVLGFPRSHHTHTHTRIYIYIYIYIYLPTTSAKQKNGKSE